MSEARFGRLSDAPASAVLVGGRVIDPAAGTDAIRDLVIADGVIVAAAPTSAERIDARGLVVAPGFCDLHVHLREPGTAGETIESGARAAARGGFTTICAMPNTQPPVDDAGAVRRAMVDAGCRVRVIGAATRGRGGTVMAPVEAMTAAGAVGFSDDGSAVPDVELARQILSTLAGLDRPLLEHAEDRELGAGAVMRAGPGATRLGLPGWPPEAEAAIVGRDIQLAAEAGAHVHLTHLSTRAAVQQVREAKARGERVTCDVTPHHLAMTEAWVAGSRAFAWEEPDAHPSRAYDGSCRVNPPLASRDDAAALMEGLADGTVDAIATDHAPHPPERTLVPFEEAAPGLIGLETALSLGLAAVGAGLLELARLMTVLSSGPAAIIGEHRGLSVGDVADVVAFDPARRWTVNAADLASASANTPLLGRELPGVVRLTLAAGRVTYRS